MKSEGFDNLVYRVTAEINRKSNEMVLGTVRDILTENGFESVFEINEKAVIKAFEALEKQMPQKVIYHDNCGNPTPNQPRCPRCYEIANDTWYFAGESYCEYCGQFLDWSEKNDR